VLSPVAPILRLASVAICLITIASFALFAIDQTSTASAHQQKELNGETTSSDVASAQGTNAISPRHEGEHKSTVRRVVDDASNAITSPFSGVTSSHSEWTIRAVRLLLALAVYGFGLAFLARLIRVRV
jgi:hypothetical protein